MAQTTNFENRMKNLMLNAWKDLDGGYEVEVYDDNGTFINAQPITFNSASNGKLTIGGDVTLNIPSDTTVGKIEIRDEIGELVQLEFVLAEADHIYFEHGGNLIVTQCDVEIGN